MDEKIYWSVSTGVKEERSEKSRMFAEESLMTPKKRKWKPKGENLLAQRLCS